ncbi:hypothetical protein PX699_15665 [Sphingobium sp. H39-3-25]|nr:hypothetical protein [Sphingobium arseniciresistens]
MGERCAIVDKCGICAATEPDQIRSTTIEIIVERMELQPGEDALHGGEMIRILRADEKVDIHETGFGGHIEPDLDVWEDQIDVREPIGGLVAKNLLVGVGDIVICRSDGLNDGRARLKRRDIVSPRIGPTKLVVEDGSWRMNMWLPPTPLRPPSNHYLSASNFPIYASA